MAYTRTTWINGSGPALNATNLNNIEAGLVDLNYSGSATWDPGSLATGAAATTTVTVTGAATGDTVLATHSSVETAATAWVLTGYVSATNTVTVVLLNVTGGTVDLASGTLRVRVFKR